MKTEATVQKIRLVAIHDDDPDLSWLEQFDINDPDPELRKYARLDRIRLAAYRREDWWCLGLRAIADVDTPLGPTTVESAGLWAIESDASALTYVETWADEFDTLRDELRELGASDDELRCVPVEVTAPWYSRPRGHHARSTLYASD
jgi:hypothetical protein